MVQTWVDITMVNLIRSKLSHLLSVVKAHKFLSSLAFVAMLSLAIYANPQAFVNLWLSRDQQAMITLNQGNAAKAALTFSDKQWIAYSYYADGDFEQSANLYAKFDGVDATFSQANALAHAGQFQLASSLYKEVLVIEPKHSEAISNLKLMDELIKKVKKSKGKKEFSNEIAKNQKFTKTDKKTEQENQPLSSELWLQRVQHNPSKFLRKKFQQEYKNAQK